MQFLSLACVTMGPTPRPKPAAEKKGGVEADDKEVYAPCPLTDLPFTRSPTHRTAPPPRSILRSPTSPRIPGPAKIFKHITLSNAPPRIQPVRAYIPDAREALCITQRDLQETRQACHRLRQDWPVNKVIPPENEPDEVAKERRDEADRKRMDKRLERWAREEKERREEAESVKKAMEESMRTWGVEERKREKEKKLEEERSREDKEKEEVVGDEAAVN